MKRNPHSLVITETASRIVRELPIQDRKTVISEAISELRIMHEECDAPDWFKTRHRRDMWLRFALLLVVALAISGTGLILFLLFSR